MIYALLGILYLGVFLLKFFIRLKGGVMAMKIIGNFIKQMFIYEYTNKNGEFKSVFGIHEVVQGPFAQKRAEKKHETHIEKLLAYPIKNRWNKELSHFSLQGHCTYLNKQKRNTLQEVFLFIFIIILLILQFLELHKLLI